MQRVVVFAALTCLGFGLLSDAHAERIKHPTGGYSLDFPSGWVIDKKKKGAFAVTHPDGSSFDVSPNRQRQINPAISGHACRTRAACSASSARSLKSAKSNPGATVQPTSA